MPVKKIAVLGCGVLEWNVQNLRERIPEITIIERFLPAQLHNNPRKLRTLLQEQIDALDAEPDLDAICLAFGVCGRGTVGLESRGVALIIPRTQDCIGISLGSHARYINEFTERPGTKYMTHGWYEKTVADRVIESHFSARDESLYGVSYDELARLYGAENAGFICQFRESWKRNYQRAAYIRFPGEDAQPPGHVISRGTAESLDWEHEELEGDESLLLAMLRGEWNDPRLLVVPPHSRTVTAPGASVIGYTTGLESKVDEVLDRYRGAGAAAGSVRRSGLGLGIDTGGTFTDAVIHDFSSGRIVAYAKAPTDHCNLVSGIEQALAALPGDRLRQVERVGISTTLATNAFVEKKGRPVALFLMGPLDIHLDALPFRHVHKIDGAMSMDGVETAALNPEQVARLARQAKAAGCEAIAVSGFGSVINPSHELHVANLVFEETGLPAVCGHELTSHLNFIERATTAAMNAKLIPLIESLLVAVTQALENAGLTGVNVMVVTGDGSQMLDRVARRFPVETVLSGPAASVVGAARLFGEADAVIADMGGTTLDVAVLKGGAPVLADRGSKIGEFQTSVRGMAIRTIGLGGDSEINLSEWPKVTIGPRRLTPVCRLSERYPGAIGRLDALFQRIVPREANVLDIVALTAAGQNGDNKILDKLGPGPMCLLELAESMNRPGPAYIQWRDLETEGKIQRFGLTLTDIMHAQNAYDAFDRDSAVKFLESWALLIDADVSDVIDAVHREFRRMVCNEILAAVLPGDCPWDETEAGLRDWLTAHLAGALDPRNPMQPAAFSAAVAYPLIPVGAPTPVLFPQMNRVLGQAIRTSEYTGVANAFGAVAGDVLVQETATVRVTEEGALLCSWRGENARAANLDEALNICEAGLTERIREGAEANDIPFREPAFSVRPHEAETKDGKIFLGLTLHAELRG